MEWRRSKRRKKKRSFHLFSRRGNIGKIRKEGKGGKKRRLSSANLEQGGEKERGEKKGCGGAGSPAK